MPIVPSTVAPTDMRDPGVTVIDMALAGAIAVSTIELSGPCPD